MIEINIILGVLEMNHIMLIVVWVAAFWILGGYLTIRFIENADEKNPLLWPITLFKALTHRK